MGLDKKRLKITIVALFAGGLYYLETQTIGWTVPCLFRLTTGFECPACGITRAILLLLHGNIGAAMVCNWGLTMALPVLALYLGVIFVYWIRGKQVKGIGITATGIGLIVYLLLWGVIRNVLNI